MNRIPLEFRFLGGTREIGRIGIAAKTEKTQVLLDYGIMMDHEPGFPMHVPPKELDAIILTHSHLDHSGAIPVFHIGERKPVYGTPLTFDLSQILISDFIHLSSYYLSFEFLELRSMMRSAVHTGYGEPKTVGDINFQLLDAGHIPGSAQVLIETQGKRVLFTGDFNTTETRLLSTANMNYGELDAIIMESTYANEDHPERKALEKEFMEEIMDIVENGGTVLVPAFSVGRSQEIACILAAYHFEYPVTIDGMAREANRIMLNYPDYVKDFRLFQNAVQASNWADGWRDRRLATKKPGVIISPAGMLKGGPAMFYVSKIGKKTHNGVFLVSYQIPGTPGRELMEKGRCVIDGKMRKVKAKVKHFDFSSHCGASELQSVVKSLKGNPTVYVVHGAEGNCEKFAKWVQKETGFNAVAPKAGDVFKV
ncbi:MAG: MBL fold metallo-hydrolase [Candidatus Bathyarchaeia archaeon]|nr:MBL fold metallo-hydrolase [Candidatus Bathyarchaeota archaeon A05DMB-4]MDH7595307.1 MBL fold metallo-hydrolase [Candidatus Bathyarchaeota archaeon]